MAMKTQMTPSKLQLTPTKMTPTKISPIRASPNGGGKSIDSGTGTGSNISVASSLLNPGRRRRQE
jgi:hypothetical protein